MAEKRMFAKKIVDSDTFLEMPISARLLYYDLGMRADDDGFVDSPKKIMKTIGATKDDMNILITRKFIIPFDSGIVVIRHWRINNYLRNDRYVETIHLHEKSLLSVDDNKQYLTHNDAISGGIPDGIPVVDADKNRIDKNRIGNNSAKNHQKEVDELFESLWNLYIRKKGKNQVSKKAKEELFQYGYEKVKHCIEQYSAEKKNCDEQYILMGSTFFNGRYKDYLPKDEPIDLQGDCSETIVRDVDDMSDEEWEKYVQSEEWENN